MTAPKNSGNTLIEVMKKYRIQNQLTQENLETELNDLLPPNEELPKKYINRLENGRVLGDLNDRFVRAASKMFNLSIDKIISLSQQTEEPGTIKLMFGHAIWGAPIIHAILERQLPSFEVSSFEVRKSAEWAPYWVSGQTVDLQQFFDDDFQRVVPVPEDKTKDADAINSRPISAKTVFEYMSQNQADIGVVAGSAMNGQSDYVPVARFVDSPTGCYLVCNNELKNALYSTISSDFFAKDERENWLKKHTFTTDLLGLALSKLNAVHKNDKYPRIAVEYSTVAAEFLRNTCSFMQQEHSFLKQSWACETSDFYLMTWKELNEKLKNNYNNALDINSHLVGAITWDPVATWLEDKEESLTKIPLMLSPNGQSRPRNITFDIIVRKSRMDESSILSAVFKLSTALFESSKAVVKLNDASRTIWPVSTYFGLHKTDKTETYIRTQSALSNIRFCVYINMDYYKSIVPL